MSLEILENSAVLQKNGHIIISCVKCGSIGVNHRLDLSRVATVQNDTALAKHREAVDLFHRAYEAQFAALRQLKAGGRNVDEQINLLKERQQTEFEALQKRAPLDMSYIQVNTCPWCEAKLNAKVTEAAE